MSMCETINQRLTGLTFSCKNIRKQTKERVIQRELTAEALF